ncbi:MAG: hypothetical protein V5A72_01775 [Candidatus Nanohaloarchaea archaeon]
MNIEFQKLYGVSGLFLIVLSLLNLFSEVGQIKHTYVFMCLGMFLFFDSLNYFLAYQESLLEKRMSPIQGLMFFLFFGAVLGFMSEIYGGVITGVWNGIIMVPESFLSVEAVNYIVEIIFTYGILVLPAYSIFRILKKVFEAETMLKREFGSDYYRYFVHLGLVLLASPFLLLVLDMGVNASYVLFLTSLVGLLLVIEYFEFRKKGQGIIANISYRELDKIGAVLTLSVLTGFIASVMTQIVGLWAPGNAPFNALRLFDTPISMVVVWTVLIWVITSGFNLVSDIELSNLSPENTLE